MDDAAYEAAWQIARALWPESRSATDPEVRRTWRRKLGRFDGEELFRAFEELGERLERFPSLATLLGACRRFRGERRVTEEQAATAGPRRHWTEQPVEERLRDFDRAAAEMREEYRREFMLFAYGDPETGRLGYKPWTWQGITEQEWLRRTAAEIAHVGPYETRARRIMAGEIEPGQGLTEFSTGRRVGSGPERVGDILRRQAVREGDLPGILAALSGQAPAADPTEAPS